MLKYSSALIVASIILGAAPASAINPKGCMISPKGNVCPATRTGSPELVKL